LIAVRDRPAERPEDRMDEPSDIDPKLLEILVCPLTKGPLRYDRGAQELISEEAGLAYPIRDGIPIMLVDEARALREDEVAQKRLPPVSER
jgi:uncharacterized protein YbaR (Trm112 family)